MSLRLVVRIDGQPPVFNDCRAARGAIGFIDVSLPGGTLVTTTAAGQNC